MHKSRTEREQELTAMSTTEEGRRYIKRKFLEILALPAGRSTVGLKSFIQMIADILDHEFAQDEQAVETD